MTTASAIVAYILGLGGIIFAGENAWLACSLSGVIHALVLVAEAIEGRAKK